jgi:hypothetical protein
VTRCASPAGSWVLSVGRSIALSVNSLAVPRLARRDFLQEASFGASAIFQDASRPRQHRIQESTDLSSVRGSRLPYLGILHRGILAHRLSLGEWIK